MSKKQKQPQEPKTIVELNYVPHPGQKLFHDSKARFRVVCCGRKWGKTTMLLMEALYWLGRPNTLIWWVAPYFAVAQMAYRRFQKEVPSALIKKIDRKNFVIEMISGAEIWFKSGDNPDSLVGEGIDLLIIDEAARVRETVWLQTLRPNLSDPGRLGYCCMASTPTGHNWFFREWMLGLRKDDDHDSWGETLEHMPITGEEIMDVHGGFPSWANPYYDREEVATNIKMPRLVFLQEYGARFLEDLGSVFQGIKKAVRSRYRDYLDLGDYGFVPKIVGEDYYMGVDLGKVHDYTVITILDKDNHVVYWDRFRHQSWTLQVEKIILAARNYNDASIFIDSTGLGDPVFDFVKSKYEHIRAVKLSAPRKREIVENLSIGIQAGHVTYPNIPELTEELSLYGAGRTAGGNIKYEAPKGFHDDCVISLGLAYWHFKSKRVKLSWEFIAI